MRGIAAILPAFNQEVSIGSGVLRTKLYADRVIIVDDGSSELHYWQVLRWSGYKLPADSMVIIYSMGEKSCRDFPYYPDRQQH